ncbi:PH domain-containing protein [Microbacterium marinilacus]|nr:PH domain-containing protein [Microbacterium marinilacus]
MAPDGTGQRPAPAALDGTGQRLAPAALDEGTYTAVREPRAAGRLALDGAWHQISPKYVVSQTVQNLIFVAVLVAIGVFVTMVSSQNWHWLGLGVAFVATIAAQIVLPRQARALGYMLRDDDIVFRKGILWQRMIAVPYGRMQLIDITHGPMDRAFGIAKLKMVTAAATTGVEIPGLSRTASEALRDTLIEVAETRRTGL